MSQIGRKTILTALAVVLVVLLGEAFWLRACGLWAMPEVDGDEAFFGIVAGRAVLGRKVPLLTSSGNIPNPFFTVPMMPLIAAFGPKFWVLRLLCLISEVLAVIVAFVVGRRLFDRTTGITLAVLVAVLPARVAYGGMGCEFSQSMLFGLIAISFAFRAKPIGTVLGALGCFLVHPTNIFLLPVLSGVFFASAWKRCETKEARQRLLAAVSALSVLAITAVGVYFAMRGLFAPGREVGSFGKRLDWRLYLTGLARFVSGVVFLPVERSGSWVFSRELGFWALVALVLFRLPRWAADQAWERLALVGGLLLSVVALHVSAGPEVLIVGTKRYGIVLLAPMVVAFALAITPLFQLQDANGQPRLRLLTVVPLLGLAFVPLSDLRGSLFVHHARIGNGSLAQPWKVRGAVERAFDQIEADLDADAPGRLASTEGSRRSHPLIVAQNWWVHKPLEYLALARPEIRIVSFDQLPGDEASRQEWLLRMIDQGALLVGWANQDFDELATELAQTHRRPLRRQEIQRSEVPVVAILQLSPESEVAPTVPELATMPSPKHH